MQAYLELLEIHKSCDYYQAALTFNKRFLSVLKPYGIKTVSYYLNKGDKIYTDEIVKVGLPCFVKPNSSFWNFKGENGSRLPMP
jgi:D-alanine-D-alanine ligase